MNPASDRGRKEVSERRSPTPHFRGLVLALLSSSLSSLTDVVPSVWRTEGRGEREECEGHGSRCSGQAHTEALGLET